MNEFTKRLIFNCIIIFGIVLILLVGIFLIIYYFNITKTDCVSNPLVYGAKQFEDRTGVKVFGSLVFLNHPELRIIFDSTNITIIT